MRIFKFKPPTKHKLMPHQRHIVAYLRERARVKKGGALFVEMRLGKTLSMIRFLKTQKGRKLIVAPLTVLSTWEEQLRGDGVYSILNLGGKTKQKKVQELEQSTAKWILLNYESMKSVKIHSFLSENDAIVLDESIAIASPATAISKYLMNRRYFPQWRKYCLSGLPAPENSMQYFNQVVFTQGSLLHTDNFYTFRSKFYDQDGYGWVPKPFTEKAICEETDKRCFVLTRNDEGLGSKKIYKKMYIPLASEQKRVYNEMLHTFALEDGDVSTNYITTQILYLARIAGGNHPTEQDVWYSLKKMGVVAELLRTGFKGEQALLWCRFRAEANKLHSYLQGKLPEARIGLITGETPREVRIAARDAFMRGELDYMVMTISTSKRGLDFSAANVAIYYSNEYSSDARGQSEDRVIHPKKQEPCYVVDLLTENTIDGDVLEILQDKKISQRMFMTKLLLKLRS